MSTPHSAGPIGLHGNDFVADPDILLFPQQPGALTGTRRAPLMLLVLCCVALVLIVVAELHRWSGLNRLATAPVVATSADQRAPTLTRIAASLIPVPPGAPSAHASSLVTLPGNKLMVFWWAGSRESGPDVKVYSSRWANGVWAAPREVASRASLGDALGFGVRRIGNPVAWAGRDGTIHLFVVATGLGGWAASRVVHVVSADEGITFTVKRVLPLSPLFNTSVLVRTSPVGLDDGGWWLPMYFELGIKYPMLMAFDADGAPRALTRIGARTTTLQPALVPVSAREAHALMRDASPDGLMQQAYTRDGGDSWEDMPASTLPNQSTSVAALRVNSGTIYLLHNYVIAGARSRSILRLSSSRDARTWQPVLDVERGAEAEEFSYPSLQQIGNELHISYTSRRNAIAHHVYRLDPAEAPL